MVATTNEGVFLTVSQENWDERERRTGDIIKEPGPSQKLSHNKELERKRAGFLIQVACTFPAMVPCLKGTHQIPEMWRPNEDRDGWKIMRPALQAPGSERRDPPKFVDAAPRLSQQHGCIEIPARLSRAPLQGSSRSGGHRGVKSEFLGRVACPSTRLTLCW